MYISKDAGWRREGEQRIIWNHKLKRGLQWMSGIPKGEERQNQIDLERLIVVSETKKEECS
jgi:hypothetical protein